MLMSMLVAFATRPGCLRITCSKANTGKIVAEVGMILYRWYRRLMTRLLESGRAAKTFFWDWADWLRWQSFLSLLAACRSRCCPMTTKQDEIVVDVPRGASLERTSAVVGEIEDYLGTLDTVVNFTSFTGTASPIDFNGLVRHYGLREMPQLARHPHKSCSEREEKGPESCNRAWHAQETG